MTGINLYMRTKSHTVRPVQKYNYRLLLKASRFLMNIEFITQTNVLKCKGFSQQIILTFASITREDA